MNHSAFMLEAIQQARLAYAQAEVPIGAVVVHVPTQSIIGAGYNTKEQCQQAVNHAEILAIQQASIYIKNWRLIECVLYSTVEPCVMCMGAILQARIQRVYFACVDTKFGAMVSNASLGCLPNSNHAVACSMGLHHTEAQSLLKQFFADRRQ
jgi:tRNA(adenine34) deaminase